MGIFEIYFFFSTKITIELFKLYMSVYETFLRYVEEFIIDVQSFRQKLSIEILSSTIDMSQELSMLLGVRFLIPV